MKVLINCSNLKKGGGVQVANSFCCDLDRFSQHQFVVVLSDALSNIYDIIKEYPNVNVLKYNSNNRLKVLLSGKDDFLDKAVIKNNVDIVFSVFGPISWIPKCPHLCGFARPHIVLTQSPYFKRLSICQRFKCIISNSILRFFFCRGVNEFFTENKFISDKWEKLANHKPVHTVTNFYNQIYDNENQWQDYKLPIFDGITLTCITAFYPHKNLAISIDIAKELKNINPNLKFRFVFTINENNFPIVPSDLKKHFLFIGKVDIKDCPSIYQQTDIMFQPTLLECFTATYPEAMRMGLPIVTTDLDFARGLCENAAVYYSPLDAKDAASKINEVITNVNFKNKLVAEGQKQLLKYDTYTQRTDKLISIIEHMYKEYKK